MLVNLKLKLPNFDIIDVHIMVVPSTRIADIVDSIRQDPRFNYLEGSHLRFIHKYMELDAEACFVDCAISNGDTIELVVKMAEDLLVSREVEYRHFLRSSSPCDGETGVSVNVVINIVFGPSKRGLVVHIPSLLSFEALLPAVYHYGDMEAALGPHMARHKGLGPLWTRHVFHNRILLLELKSKNSAEDNEFRDHVEKVGYSWRGVNDGYFEGDVHSWQRYTTELPIECRVGSTTAGMGVDECSVTVQPHFRLKYGTYYAIYLGNNVPTGLVQFLFWIFLF